MITKGNIKEVVAYMKPLVAEYLAAKVELIIRDEIISNMENNLLADEMYYNEDEERITSSDHTYDMTESDWFRYQQKWQPAIDKLDYNLEPGKCPVLVSQCLVHQLEEKIILRMEKYLPLMTKEALLRAGLPKYEKYIELIIKVVNSND